MPTGRLKAGRAKVAGVASEEALAALRVFQRERGLPTLSRALGALLEDWQAGGNGVLHPAQCAEGQTARPSPERVLRAPTAQGEAFPPSVRLDGLKSFARNRLSPDHPLRDVLLAEADVLPAEEFLVKLSVWSVLISRKA